MKFLKILLFFHIFRSCSSTLLIDKAAFFANSVFKEFIASVVWWRDNPEVTEFIQQYQGCIVLSRLQDSNNQFLKSFNKKQIYAQSVFFAFDLAEVEYFMALLNEDLIRPIRLIVVLLQPSTYDKLTELMEMAWKNDFTDILVLSSSTEDVSLTTYFPYGKGKCGDYSPVHLDHDTTDLFPKKFKNFHGCEVKTMLLHMPPFSRLTFDNDTVTSISGIDGNIFNILIGLINASMNIVSATDHGGIGAIVNGTATGLLADLINKKADIVCPAFIMTYSRYAYFQFSHVYETCDIHWFGPKRLEISEWLRVLQPFLSTTTPVLLAASIVFALVIMSVHQFGLHKSIRQSSVLFQTFIIFLGQEAKFVTSSRLLNSLFMLWIWFCMVVRIAYQGVLVKGLQKTTLQSPLGDFECAVNKINSYGGIESFKEFYTGTPYFDDYVVLRFNSLPQYLKDIEAGKEFLLVTDIYTALDAAPQIQVLSNDPVSQPPLAFFMRPGWPAVADVSNILLHIIEAGITQKVLKNYYWEWVRHVSSNFNRDARPLTLETLIGCFYGLGVMYLVCTLVVIMEIIHHKYGYMLYRYIFTRRLPFLN